MCVCSQARTRVQACVWADCCAARRSASESRVGTWQVSDRHVTTEGRPTLNSAWAAQELLEGAGLSCGSQGQGCRAGAHYQQPWAAGHLRSLGAERVLMQKERWAEARRGTGWSGGVVACFHRTVALKGRFWILFPQTAILSGSLCLGFRRPPRMCRQ